MTVIVADGGANGSASRTTNRTSSGMAARRRHKPLQEQKFASYLSFGFPVTVCLGIFLSVYVLILICASPLLQQEAPTEVHMKRGTVLKPMVENIKKHVHLPNAHATPEIEGALKEKVVNLRKHQSDNDLKLIAMAQKELDEKKRHREEQAKAQEQQAVALPDKQSERKGFVLLGMHRSGTSMLGGLLVTGLGYNVGSPLIRPGSDNEKGFFELIPAVLQNDEFMNLQRIWWSANVINYSDGKALEDKRTGKATFREGNRALAFLNNPDNAPWMQKDPRMCITLRTWLELLNSQPAVIFTYRHPMEVAHSLIRREPAFTLDHALRLWFVYNMRGVENSSDLCRITTSNEAILANPLVEVQRLSDELTSKCGVPAPPHKLDEEVVSKFVDTSLLHSKKKYGEDLPVIEEHGDCKIHELVTKTPPDSPQYQLEKNMYLKAMRLFCDLESGAAYQSDYQWPRE